MEAGYKTWKNSNYTLSSKEVQIIRLKPETLYGYLKMGFKHLQWKWVASKR